MWYFTILFYLYKETTYLSDTVISTYTETLYLPNTVISIIIDTLYLPNIVKYTHTDFEST